MAIKESSDELNHPVTTTGVSIARPSSSRSLKDYLALAIATCGVGYLPLAPGTWGSLIGVGIYLLWQLLKVRIFLAYGDGHWTPLWLETLWTTFTLALVFGITMAGIWAATHVEKVSGRKDASIIVIDEVAGQLIALLFIPFFWWGKWQLIVAGFLLFRIFDIWKPYPIRRLESIESGLGVMADDVLAGIYAVMVLSLVTAIYSLI